MKIFTTPTEIAQAINFGKYPVLKINTDTKEGSKAVIIHKSSRYGNMRYNCTLEMDYEKAGDGKLYLSINASCLKGTYNWTDYLEDVEFANAPIIDADQEVAIYMYSPSAKIGFVRMVKSGKIDHRCSVATLFKDIEEQ